MVEHNLAKVRVAGSSPVFRSSLKRRDARMVESVDTKDLKSFGQKWLCGFKSHSRYFSEFFCRIRRGVEEWFFPLLVCLPCWYGNLCLKMSYLHVWGLCCVFLISRMGVYGFICSLKNTFFEAKRNFFGGLVYQIIIKLYLCSGQLCLYGFSFWGEYAGRMIA